MQLMTQAIAAKLLKADQHFIRTGKTSDAIVVKYFNPCGQATWYIVSGTPLDENGEPVQGDPKRIAKHWRLFDWHLYGFCDLGDVINAELGYVLLSELRSIRLPFGLTIERDLYYGDNRLLSHVQKRYEAARRAA